ncbi:MAG: N-acetylmuramoyl-L-alanine amidase [Planctomycetota bacterium]|nr:N-acetylmuramoyl-L-alanine amidase [Planctomycetota bacterium]
MQRGAITKVSGLMVMFVILAGGLAAAQTRVCVDPGHGGTDSGAVGYGLLEKNINLDASLWLRDLFNADTADTLGGSSWQVYLTRSTDATVSLSGRTNYANSVGANRFISIHCNAFNGAAYGTETFSYSGTGTSADLRNKIQPRLVSYLGTYDRGVKTAGYYVLVHTSMPAVLAELAFIDHSGDSAKLATASVRQQAARAILHGTQTHMGITAYDPGSAAPPPPTYNAQFIGQSCPTTMTAGQQVAVWVDLKNTGTGNWTSAATRLGTSSPANHASLFFTNGNWISSSRAAGVNTTTAPGAVGRFNFILTAPIATSATTFTEKFKAVQGDSTWFGPEVVFTITVQPLTVIVDNTSSGFYASSNWGLSDYNSLKYGANYRYRTAAAVSDLARWNANLPLAGAYKVYAWFPSHSQYTVAAKYFIYHTGGTATITVSQQASGGQWVSLGTFNFAAGNAQRIAVSCWTSGTYIVADAVKFVKN